MPTITISDREIHYVDEGGGDDPVVLLHAVPLTSAMWEPQVQALSRSYRMIAPDLAGFGDSDAPEDAGEWRVEGWADDVIGLLAVLGLDHVTLVGASLGADVALAVTRRSRDMVGALVLAGLRGAIGAEEERQRLEQARWLADGGDPAPIVDELVNDLVGTETTGRGQVVKQVRWMMDRTPPAGWARGLEAMIRRPDPVAEVAKVDMPTLLVAGEDDRLAPPDEARELAGDVTGAGVVEVPRSGHLPSMENPAVFNRALEDVLAGREARRSSGKHSWPASPPIASA